MRARGYTRGGEGPARSKLDAAPCKYSDACLPRNVLQQRAQSAALTMATPAGIGRLPLSPTAFRRGPRCQCLHGPIHGFLLLLSQKTHHVTTGQLPHGASARDGEALHVTPAHGLLSRQGPAKQSELATALRIASHLLNRSSGSAKSRSARASASAALLPCRLYVAVR
jgi:hypothetical protein